MKRLKILCLCWLSALLFSIAPILLQDTAGVKISEKFLTYQNSRLGFNISYPTGWQVIEENPDRVIFNSFGNATVRIIVDNVTKFGNMSSEGGVSAHNYAINGTKNLGGIASYAHITSVFVGTSHQPGWSVDYFIPPSHILDTVLVTNGKLFTINFVITAIKEDKVLATLQSMMSSFQVT